MPHNFDRDIVVRVTVGQISVAAAALITLGAAVPIGLAAATVSYSHTFANGEVADADHVNANFTDVKTQVDAHADAIAANADAIADLSGRVSGQWRSSYFPVTTTNAHTLVGVNDVPLGGNWRGLVTCGISSTNAPGTSTWLVTQRPDGTIYLEKIASHSSTGSNTPELFIDAGTIKVRLYSHSSDYGVNCVTLNVNQ